jgi:hypothetical protein
MILPYVCGIWIQYILQKIMLLKKINKKKKKVGLCK